MYSTLLEQARSLPLEDRARLVQELWESLVADGPDPDLSSEQAEELDRRLAEHRANPQDVVPWEQIHRSLVTRLNS